VKPKDPMGLSVILSVVEGSHGVTGLRLWGPSTSATPSLRMTAGKKEGNVQDSSLLFPFRITLNKSEIYVLKLGIDI
jgi:hypothetical protein